MLNKTKNDKYIFFVWRMSRKLKSRKALREMEIRRNGRGLVVTGYPDSRDGEVESMLKYLIGNGVPESQIFVDPLYETFSNVESLEKYLINGGIELKECEISASTGSLHWFRFRLIFLWEFLYGKNHFDFSGIKISPFRRAGSVVCGYSNIALHSIHSKGFPNYDEIHMKKGIWAVQKFELYFNYCTKIWRKIIVKWKKHVERIEFDMCFLIKIQKIIILMF